MALAVSIFGVALVAFYVWLTVRIVNRRGRWAKWTLVVVAIPSLYVLSFGPACWATDAGLIGVNQAAAIYLPVLKITWRYRSARGVMYALASPGKRCEATAFRLLERPWPKPIPSGLWLPDLKSNSLDQNLKQSPPVPSN
jgi:hypothetical protein